MDVKVTSKIGKSNCQADQLFKFLSNFDNVKKIIPPEQAEKFDSNGDSCTIKMNSYASIDLQIVELQEDKLVKIASEDGKESVTIWLQFKQPAPYDTRLRITIQAKANLMTKWMIKKQLQKFVDSFVDGICQIPAQALTYAMN